MPLFDQKRADGAKGSNTRHAVLLDNPGRPSEQYSTVCSQGRSGERHPDRRIEQDQIPRSILISIDQNDHPGTIPEISPEPS